VVIAMSQTFEQTIRDLVVQEVRTEVRRQVSEALRADEFISTHTAAKLAEVSTATVRRWVKVGKLARCGVKGDVGRTGVLRISRLELERLLRTDAAQNDEGP
jgi:predicted transcriptional regulator